MVLVTRNRDADGLGLPLPAGSVILFAQGPTGRSCSAGARVADRAVGEDVEIEFDEASGVTTQIELIRETRRWAEYRLIATNDQRRPVRFEAEFPLAGDDFRPDRRLGRRDGRPFWSTTIPANARITLRYRILKVAEVSPV